MGFVLKQLQVLRAEPIIATAPGVSTSLGFGAPAALSSPFGGALVTATSTSTAVCYPRLTLSRVRSRERYLHACV